MKRNPIGDKFDNNVIEEMQSLTGSIADHLAFAQQDTDKLQEYMQAYNDGSWKFGFITDINYEIRKIEKKFDNVWNVLETFKDPEE